MKQQAASQGWAVDGAVIALVVGGMAFAIGGVTDQFRALLMEPLVLVLGLGSAAVLGPALARRAVTGTRMQATAAAIGLGAGTPTLVALVLGLPVVPIAIAFSTVIWPITIPAGITWLFALRRHARRPLAQRRAVDALGVALVSVLLLLRFTQPMISTSSTGAACVAFPGERIETLAWSPDGAWLGLTSDAGGGIGVVRLIEQATGRIVEVARGADIEVSAGVAVGPGAQTTYISNLRLYSSDARADEWSAWTGSPSSIPTRLTNLPTPLLYDLTWTPEGVVAVWVDGPKRLVWIRRQSMSIDGLDEVDAKAIARNPVLAPLVEANATELIIRLAGNNHRVTIPDDASSDISVTPDGRYVVFHARAISSDGNVVLHDHLVALSTVTGDSFVLVEEPTWDAQLAVNAVAYLTFPADKGNSACVKALAVT